ncbi:MAG: FAD-dependent tricarballylate dehydrogenase TcuA [Chloroflexi bacterium]|nr:FAD-dependent tricarballylate dehydrogenase TcuA [Chloroflexota bacterium]
MTSGNSFDVIVVGAGNAGLCAAMAAREAGVHTLVLEKAPKDLRGGNSYFTGGLFRFAFTGLEDVASVVTDLTEGERAMVDVGSYPQRAYYEDVMRVTEGLTDPALLELLVGQSLPTAQWMAQQGVRFVLALGRQSFKVGDKFKFFGNLVVEAVGGGVGLSDMEFQVAEKMGIEVWYDTKASKLITDRQGRVTGLTVRGPEGYQDVATKTVVLACGGFEANAEMRTRYLGAGWELARVRGTQFNTGDGHRMALEIGAQPFGHWSGAHACAWDYNAPPYGDRKITDLFQKHSYPYGLVVNIHGQRFLDEGADYRNYTYAKYGREILQQPQRAAFQIFDQKVIKLLRDEYRIREVTKATADTMEELAEKLGIDREGLAQTVREYNAAVRPGEFNPSVLDGCHTEGITPPKSNWALPLDTPPYEGYAVTCGVTFTFGGLRINPRAQALDTEERPIPGLYAAGEIVGGLFYYNYPGGAGLMAGSVFGRTAGRSAAAEARG